MESCSLAHDDSARAKCLHRSSCTFRTAALVAPSDSKLTHRPTRRPLSLLPLHSCLPRPHSFRQTVRVTFLEPLFESQLEMRNPVFALKGEQEEKVEKKVTAFKNHLQFEQLLGRSPPLTDTELQATLRKKALDLEREEREQNCVALANFVTDSTFAIILTANLLLQLDEAEKLRKTLSKEFFSLDSSRQAFILLLVSDILVGYHSAEGWSTGLESIGGHYGLEARAQHGRRRRLRPFHE